jgi:tetratricopeptide (TPR) repeat protein
MKSGRGTILLQAALLAMAIPLLVRLTGTSKPDFEFAKGERLLVADFINATEDDALEVGLDQVLKLALSQSQLVRLYPDSEVRLALRRMRVDSQAGLTPDLAARICRQEKIPVFIVPRLSRMGRSYLMSVQLSVNRNSIFKELPVDMVRASNQTGLIRAVDELSMKIRRMLGESDRSLAGTAGILPSSAIEQAEALTLLVRALALESRENYAGALGMLQQAVLLNPRFALAQLNLGDLLIRLGSPEAAIDHIARALEESDALPLKESLRARGIYNLLKGEYGAARGLFRALAVLYPWDRDTQMRLADLELQWREFDRAIMHIENAVRLEPSRAESYLALCMACLYARDIEAARRALSEAQGLEPENPGVICTSGFVDLMDNDLGSALRTFRQVTESPSPHTRSMGLFLTAQAQIYGGRFHSALETLKGGIDLDRGRGDRTSEASKRLSRAQIYLLLGDESNALEECRQAPIIKDRAEYLRRIGLVYAHAGRIAEARGMLDQIEKLPNTTLHRYHAAILAGEIELASGRPQAAVPILAGATQSLPGWGASEPLARALFQAQRYREAGTEYLSVCAQKAEMLFPKLDGWFMGTWPNALYETARCLTELHKYQDAIQYYRSYTWVLDGSDAGIPKVRLARECLRKGAAGLSSQH